MEARSVFLMLDNPKMLLGFKLKDLMLALFLLYAGVLLSQVILGIVLTACVFWKKRKMEREHPKKYFLGLAYFLLPKKQFSKALSLQKLPDSSKKRYMR